MRKRLHIAVIALAAALLLNGCALLNGRRSGASDLALENPPPVHPTDTVGGNMVPAEGSLFDPSFGGSLWADDVARGIGDVVTVQVSVENKGEHKATTDLSRTSKMDASVESLFGYENSFPGVGTNNTTPAQLIKTASSNEFTGDGDTLREGKLTADVSAIVTQVFPNGNMRIHGSQSLLVNNETSILTVDGVIRPSDLSSENTVGSERIANARIEITGRGVVSDKQRPGILSRVFDWMWPL
ncbi:flagellar basal body L-ring protein FlgH [Candidatus Sumerlaeota bacterium]|nr:flagellar basal body L-ring protein FlgH [Candidatus Sumerlaeota bacterium]